MTPHASAPVHDYHVLVVEDEFMLATELEAKLNDAGIVVIGPVSTLEDGCRVCREVERIDGAVLDISLHGKMVFPLADELRARRVPFLFATGYDADIIPERFRGVECHPKPIYVDKVIAAISTAMDASLDTPAG